MKKFLFLTLLFVSMLVEQADAQRKLFIEGITDPDTLVTSSSTGSVYVYPGGTTVASSTLFEHPGSLFTTFRGDSLAGGTNARAILKYCADDLCTIVANIDTLTLNGATALYLTYNDDNFNACRFFWEIQSNGSTSQTTKGQAAYCYKRTTQ